MLVAKLGPVTDWQGREIIWDLDHFIPVGHDSITPDAVRIDVGAGDLPLAHQPGGRRRGKAGAVQIALGVVPFVLPAGEHDDEGPRRQMVSSLESCMAALDGDPRSRT